MQHTPGDMMVVHAKGSTPPGVTDEAANPDMMAKLMGDWSWCPEMQPVDPGYVYTADERREYLVYVAMGLDMPGVQPWMVKAYTGPAERPKRIGG